MERYSVIINTSDYLGNSLSIQLDNRFKSLNPDYILVFLNGILLEPEPDHHNYNISNGIFNMESQSEYFNVGGTLTFISID